MGGEHRRHVAERTFVRALNGRDKGGQGAGYELWGARIAFRDIPNSPRYAGARRMTVTLPDRSIIRVQKAEIYDLDPRALDQAMMWFCAGIDSCGNIIGWTDDMRRDWLDAMEADNASDGDIAAFLDSCPRKPSGMSGREFRSIRLRMGLDIPALSDRLREPPLTVRTWDDGLSSIPGAVGVLMTTFLEALAIPALRVAA